MLTMACLMMMLLPGDSARNLGDYLREAMDALPIATNENGKVYPDVVLAGFETVREVNETNKVHGTTGRLIQDPAPFDSTDLLAHCHFEDDPNVIYETTTHKRYFELRFEWRGQDRTFIDSEILWTKTRKLVLKQDWVEEIVP